MIEAGLRALNWRARTKNRLVRKKAACEYSCGSGQQIGGAAGSTMKPPPPPPTAENPPPSDF